MVFIWYLYGIYMVFIWYLYGIYIRATTEGNTRQKEFSHRFSWGNMDFCLSLQSKIQ